MSWPYVVPTSAPAPAPTNISGTMPSSSQALRTPRCASPRAAPPEPTKAILRRPISSDFVRGGRRAQSVQLEVLEHPVDFVPVVLAPQPEDNFIPEEPVRADMGRQDRGPDHHVVRVQRVEADRRVRRRLERVLGAVDLNLRLAEDRLSGELGVIEPTETLLPPKGGLGRLAGRCVGRGRGHGLRAPREERLDALAVL